MWKGIAANALTMLIVLLIAAAALVAWGRNQYVSPGPLTASVCLRVESGARMASVSRNLEELGAVSSARIFRIGVEYSGRAPQLKAGSHLIEAGASMEDVLDTITRSGAQTCGAEVILRIGVTASDVLLRELDPGTGVSTELAKYVPGVDPVPEAMAAALAEAGIRYWPLPALGGRRKPLPDSPNTAWRVEAFRAYDDYMADPEYIATRARLMETALRERTCVMCAEAVWWRCHRRLIADDFIARGWAVLDIMAPGKVEPHVLNPDAVMTGGVLRYPGPQAPLL